MTLENLKDKKALLTDQLHNLDKSGFFTDEEIERLSKPFLAELADITNEIHYFSITEINTTNKGEAI